MPELQQITTMFKCANCLIEYPREMAIVVEDLDGDNLIVIEICPMCADYRKGCHEREERQTVVVTRQMALDAQCPEMEGYEILW